MHIAGVDKALCPAMSVNLRQTTPGSSVVHNKTEKAWNKANPNPMWTCMDVLTQALPASNSTPVFP